MRQKRRLSLSRFLYSIAVAAVFGVMALHSQVAVAGKLSLLGGAYSFSAENSSSRVTSTLTGFGSYQIAYRHQMLPGIELDFGYSLVATEIVTGDLAFGFDVGINYFPLTMAGQITADLDAGTVILNERWRPFIGGSFNQRNFQSTSLQYAGFGVKAGAEYQYSDEVCFQGVFRYLILGGPNQSGATHIDMLGGLVFQF